MFKRLFLLLILLFASDVFSQYIKGKVVDENKQPLPSATVYYEGTTMSTLTDEQGNFILVYEPKIKRPIVISYMGYVTAYAETYKVGDPLMIIMQQASNSLKEVVIKKSRFSRKEKMIIFKERFLGISPFGLRTVIENEADIELEYDEEKMMLKAYSDKPLIIINRSLGYKINYEMIEFEIQFNKVSLNPHAITNSFYSGYTRFEEIKSTASVKRNRKEAYNGSPMHFFRCLTNNSWGKDSFQLFLKGIMTNPINHFTVLKEGENFKVLIKKQDFPELKDTKFTAVLGLLYNNIEQSSVYFYSDTIDIDSYGNLLSTREVAFSGEIQFRKFGDTLPINYGLE
ncbi:carboxypeptidase-like regulatory domain-containing protein [Flavobacterium sp.]|jgi:hypothetical protein|uniref:carboxypeptidase-like regulatory domain-containing protein n=1 Tax=Flavobacterium sp. TaxID=239 RepID=UPI0037C09F6A